MSPITKVIADDVLEHLCTLSRLSQVHINKIAEHEDQVCPINVDQVACDVVIDVGVRISDANFLCV